MSLPANASVVVVRGFWLDETTGQGVRLPNSSASGTVTFTPLPLNSLLPGTKTPNLRDLEASGFIKTRPRVATANPVTGYFATLMVANDDPDLDAYGGRLVQFSGEDPFVIAVPHNAPFVSADTQMVEALSSTLPELEVGDQVRAVWLTAASLITTPVPTPPVTYLTAEQTLETVESGVEAHAENTSAHPDIRELIEQLDTGATGGAGGVLSGTYPNPGFAVDMATQAELNAVAAAVPEQARDALGAALVAGANVTITPDDAGDTITIAASVPAGYSDEQAQDAFAALIAAGSHSGITFAYSDVGNAISATVAAQSWTQITGKPTFAAVATSGSYTDLSNKPTIPTTAAGISDFTEAAQDAVAAMLGAGSNVILNYDDAANTLTVSATGSGGTGLDAEQVRDAIGVALVGVGNIAVVVNDAADTITISTTATANSTDAQLRDRSTHTGGQDASTITSGIIDDARIPAAIARDSEVTAALAGKQNADSDLTTIAGLDSATAGMLATDGSGWLRKTYAQVRTALGLATVATSGSATDLSTGTLAEARIDSAIARDSEVTTAVGTRAPAQGLPLPGATADGATDDFAALTAYIAGLPANATVDLGGCSYRVSAPLVLNKAMTLRNGLVTAGDHNALTITAPGVTLGPALQLFRSSAPTALSTTASRALVAASAPFRSYDVDYSGSAQSCVHLGHGQCNGTVIRGGTMVNNAAHQDAGGVYAAAGATGNVDISIENVNISGTCSQGIAIFDAKRCTIRNNRINGMTVLPTLTVTGWAATGTGTVYRARMASGTPGSTGPTTDRNDGNTRVVRNGATLLVEGATATNPGTNRWGTSGGYLYLDLGGTDPNTATITSDIVSGYGITLYSTANGFTDMSENLVALNHVSNVQSFGIYMQLSNYADTCVDNKTIGNVLRNVCTKGSQTTLLPYAGIGWNGGINCLSLGDHIDTVGSAGFPVPGFFASDASVVCRGQAVGVTVVNSFGEGFRLTNASNWTYNGCEASNNATSGFRAFFPATALVRGIEIIGCRGRGNVLRGIDLDASTTGAYAAATITGGVYHDNGQQGIQLSAVRNTTVTAVQLHNNGVTSFHQIRFVGDCKDSGFNNLDLYHSLAGQSISIAQSQTTDFFYGNITIPSNLIAPFLGTNQFRVGGAPGVGSEFAGSGVPTIAGVIGDRYWRRDTPGTTNQRLYLCTTAGAAGAATWTPVL